MKIDVKKVISQNTKQICQKWNLNTVTLGEKSKTSQTTARRLLKGDDERKFPRIDSIQAVADCVNVDLWQMFFENMPIELLGDKSVTAMIKTLAECSSENRQRIYDQIESIARSDKMEKELKALKGK